MSPPAARAAFHRGFNFDHTGDFERRMDPRLVEQSLDTLVTLGVDHVSVTPSFFQQTLDDTSFHWKRSRSRIDDEVRWAIRLAHDRGLRVLLKPHLWLVDKSDGAWRGQIAPGPRAWPLWRANYRAVLLDYARMAAEERVAVLSLGSELTALAVAHPEFWSELAADVRRVFSGELTYAANWYQEVDQIRWWRAVDYIGVDAFWPLVDTPDMSLSADGCRARYDEIRNALAAICARFERPLLITEIGAKSAAGSAHEPWLWHDGQPVDLELQVRFYDCVLDTFDPGRPNNAWVRGIYFWKWYADLGWGGEDNSDFTPRGKPAERVIAEHWLQVADTPEP